MRTIFSRTPEGLVDPGIYPVSLWAAQRTKYWNYWRHFDGDWLDATVSTTNRALKYPLKLNPFNMPCILHAGFLFGEVQDGSDPLVTSVVEPWGRESPKEVRDTAVRLTDLINQVWCENNGRALQQEAGLISQILGGCVLGAFYDPQREADGCLPIRIEHVLPEYFFPVPAPTQYWELLETFICFELSKRQAELMYGADAAYDQALYQEWWRPDHYEITVEGTPVSWGGIKMEGVPLGRRVPYIYIPHIRAGEFYGISLLQQKEQMAIEINERFADCGDIVSENARLLPAVLNAQRLSTKRLSDGTVFLDLGTGVPGMGEPGIIYPTGIRADKSLTDWALELLNLARTEAYTPPVCYGVDEGSQRSALTLVMRMLPLLIHIRQERTLWTAGLNQLARLILTIAAEKNIEGVTPDMLKDLRIWQEWAPIMPRDHDQLVNELILRLQANLVSPETALDRLGDIRDVQTELNLIKAWMEYAATVQVPAANPFGGAGSGGEQAGLNRPSKPKPTVSKENA